MRRLLKPVALALALSFATSVFAATPAADARTYVDKVAGDALKVLQTQGLSKSQKSDKLELMFRDVVDIPYVARFVLGRHWRTASPAQQEAYLKAYEPFLIRNYVGRVVRYSGETYKVTESRDTPDGAIVSMVLKSPDGSSPDVVVSYRLSKVEGAFKVVDIIVEGVSLLNTQRSEFNSIVANQGLDYLINALNKKNAARKA
jgi:phospholipid transport system substrate-binding protein